MRKQKSLFSGIVRSQHQYVKQKQAYTELSHSFEDNKLESETTSAGRKSIGSTLGRYMS